MIELLGLALMVPWLVWLYWALSEPELGEPCEWAARIQCIEVEWTA